MLDVGGCWRDSRIGQVLSMSMSKGRLIHDNTCMHGCAFGALGKLLLLFSMNTLYIAVPFAIHWPEVMVCTGA